MAHQRGVVPMRAIVLAVLASLPLLAGCAGPDASPADEAGTGTRKGAAAAVSAAGTPGDVPPAPVVTVMQEGRAEVEVAAWIAGPQSSHGWELEFEVEDGATGVVVELAWADAVQDLDLLLNAPGDCFSQVGFPDGAVTCIADVFVADGEYGTWWNKDGHAGAPDNPARIAIGPADVERWGSGTWSLVVWTKDANAQLDFTMYASALYDGSDPTTFSAIPA